MTWKYFNQQPWIKFVIGNNKIYKIFLDDFPSRIEIADGTLLIGEMEIRQPQDIPYLLRYAADKIENYLKEEGHR